MDEDSVRLAHRLSRLEAYMDRQLAITHLAMAMLLGCSAGALVISILGAIS